MKKKFLVLITDDWEIKGNGTGNVAELQYLPTLAMMNILEKYGATMTIMVEAAQQLVMRQFLHIPDIRIQSKIWDETVLLMKERGFDVQLHLHAQWTESSYRDGHFHLSDKWNVALYTSEEQERLLTRAMDYLHGLLRGKFPDYRVCGFKAGSWGLQPEGDLMKIFRKLGFNVIMGPRDGLKVKELSTDYSGMEEKYLPYYPDDNDVTKMAEEAGPMAMIPLQPYAPDLLTFGRYLADQVINKFRFRDNTPYYHAQPIPDTVKNLNPLSGKELFTLSTRPYRTHLKIGSQPFSYMKASFDTVIDRLDRFDLERIPVLIESHTKQYHHYYRDIEKFIDYVCNRYEANVEFGDVTTYSRELLENPALVKKKEGALAV